MNCLNKRYDFFYICLVMSSRTVKDKLAALHLRQFAVQLNESDTNRRQFTSKLKFRQFLELETLKIWIRISSLH